MMCEKKIPKSVIERLPTYLHYLKSDMFKDNEMVSSVKLAKIVGYGEVLVRKDLAMVSGTGKPKIGYNKNELVMKIMEALDCVKMKNAIIVGGSHFDSALLLDESFSEYNIFIKAKFEINYNGSFNRTNVFPLSDLKEYCKKEDISIGIITVGEKDAQAICDLLVSLSIKAIWNFSPVKLKVPENVKVKEENMAASLAALAANI